jgi:hypothetical protein
LAIAAEAAPPKGLCTVSKQVDVPAKMRDGVTLLAEFIVQSGRAAIRFS